MAAEETSARNKYFGDKMPNLFLHASYQSFDPVDITFVCCAVLGIVSRLPRQIEMSRVWHACFKKSSKQQLSVRLRISSQKAKFAGRACVVLRSCVLLVLIWPHTGYIHSVNTTYSSSNRTSLSIPWHSRQIYL